MHLPCYIVIIASFVTIVQMFMQAYMESLYNALGVFCLLYTSMFAVCGCCAVLSMLVGVWVFRKTQDRFGLHI